MTFEIGALISSGGEGQIFEVRMSDVVTQNEMCIKAVNIGMENQQRRAARIQENINSNFVLKTERIVRVGEDRIGVIMRRGLGDMIQFTDNSLFELTKTKDIIFLQICKGIEDMHSKNYIWGDCKPENMLIVLITSSNIPIAKIIDLSYSTKVVGRRLATSARSPGTRFFKAPEVGHAPFSFPADVWAFGVSMYLMYTFKAPFTVRNDIPDDSWNQHSTECFFEEYERYQLNTERDEFQALDSELQQLIIKCLKINPADRIKINEISRSHYFYRYMRELESCL